MVLVPFGGAELPQLASSPGQAQAELERGRQEGLRSDEPDPTDRDGATDPSSHGPRGS